MSKEKYVSEKQEKHLNEPSYYDGPQKNPFKWSRFIYNGKEGTVLGRDCGSWVKIGIFYSIFYAALAALVALCMWVFFQTLDPRIPKWKLKESIIGTNPGLGFRPMPPSENVESTLIWYKGTNYENYRTWTDALDKFLAIYKTPGVTTGRGQNIFNCKYNSPPPPGKVCDVNIKDFKKCTQENNYSYHKSSPCVFIKLNRIYGWVPEYYNNTNYLPNKMPRQLKQKINETDPQELNTVWISCEGENPADVENMGPIEYYPRQGFPGYYFPYENSEGYLSPLVAIHFTKPTRGIIINVECKAWAYNIKHDRKERQGSVHFELMID